MNSAYYLFPLSFLFLFLSWVFVLYHYDTLAWPHSPKHTYFSHDVIMYVIWTIIVLLFVWACWKSNLPQGLILIFLNMVMIFLLFQGKQRYLEITMGLNIILLLGSMVILYYGSLVNYEFAWSMFPYFLWNCFTLFSLQNLRVE